MDWRAKWADGDMPMTRHIGPVGLARRIEVVIECSCPFAGMTRIRFKGSPLSRFLSLS
jgi:hypothetical protein